MGTVLSQLRMFLLMIPHCIALGVVRFYRMILGTKMEIEIPIQPRFPEKCIKCDYILIVENDGVKRSEACYKCGVVNIIYNDFIPHPAGSVTINVNLVDE